MPLPPSTTIVWPVTKSAPSISPSATCATSSGLATRPSDRRLAASDEKRETCYGRMLLPPSTVIVWPVTKSAPSMRLRITCATSSGDATRWSGVVMLTRELGTAWARQGIRVNCVAPGPVETEGFLDVLKKAEPDAEKTYKAVASWVGMGRWGRVEEIAYPCIFLASDASSWMTGETIVVDGGNGIRP